MSIVLHIVRKDFRHLRYYLAGWLGLLVLRAAVIGYGPLDSSTWDFASFNYYEILAWFPQICLLPIMVARLVQDDSLAAAQRSGWAARLPVASFWWANRCFSVLP